MERRRFGRPPPTHKRRPSRRIRGRPAAPLRSQNGRPAAPQGHPRRQPLQGGASAVVLQCQKLTIRLGGQALVLSGRGHDNSRNPVGLYGYYASQQANRVNRTFDFYKDFHGDGLQKDFSLLVTRWNEKSPQADRLLKSDDFTGLEPIGGLTLANRRNADCALAADSLLR